MKLQQALAGPSLKVQADGAHVANHLVGRFLKRKVKGALTAAAGGINEVCGQTGLAGARCARHQNGAAAIKALAAQHLVEAGNAGGKSLIADPVLQVQRSDGQHAEAVLVDQEGIFVGAVSRAAVFDHAQPPRGNLVFDAVIEQNDAIGNIFFQAVARQCAVAALGGDDGRHALVLEPAEQPAQLRAQDALVMKSGEQVLDGVEHHPLGVNRIDGGANADEQTFQIVVAGFLNLTGLDANEIDDQLFLLDQLVEIEAQGANVAAPVPRRFLQRR